MNCGIAVAVPAVVGLAFGGGVAVPLEVYTWPVRTILWAVNPQAGSGPAFDLGGVVVLSAVLWLCVAIAVDTGVSVVKARL